MSYFWEDQRLSAVQGNLDLMAPEIISISQWLPLALAVNHLGSVRP